MRRQIIGKGIENSVFCINHIIYISTKKISWSAVFVAEIVKLIVSPGETVTSLMVVNLAASFVAIQRRRC
ncbi:hypothetical protein MNBD_GAMMA07-924 [hydrothermal vent metagenome]|uniref:Uncharacterized protein n=1 Tax=hydrothermal vent metagenome TaxID=652676 RepID=A0A3B0WIM3_9ZZZZ